MEVHEILTCCASLCSEDACPRGMQHARCLCCQGMVKLLASNPDDKDVVKEVARALKFMAAERTLPEQVQQRGRALLSRWSRRISFLLHDKFEWNIKDSSVWSVLVASFAVGVVTVLAGLKYLLI